MKLNVDCFLCKNKKEKEIYISSEVRIRMKTCSLQKCIDNNAIIVATMVRKPWVLQSRRYNSLEKCVSPRSPVGHQILCILHSLVLTVLRQTQIPVFLKGSQTLEKGEEGK